MSVGQKDKRSAVAAQADALRLSFAPVLFQTAYALWQLGILTLLAEHGTSGLSAKCIAEQLNISEYGVKVLLDFAVSADIVWRQDEHYILDKVGHFIAHDKMVQVNFNFVQDFCYQGLQNLLASIRSGKPEGLKVYGDWATVYPALSSLPEPAKSSWFAFDHFYSDKAFTQVLPLVFAKPVNKLLDIGGNTGKWALSCFNYDQTVEVTIADLAPQLAVARDNISQAGFTDRLQTLTIDFLSADCELPNDEYDVIWMSQFLDCFSDIEILHILRCVAKVMTANTRLYILELCGDRQQHQAAAFSINATSIYFTCFANGNSRMYHSQDLIKLLQKAGFHLAETHDHIATGHSLFMCQLAD